MMPTREYFIPNPVSVNDSTEVRRNGLPPPPPRPGRSASWAPGWQQTHKVEVVIQRSSRAIPGSILHPIVTSSTGVVARPLQESQGFLLRPLQAGQGWLLLSPGTPPQGRGMPIRSVGIKGSIIRDGYVGRNSWGFSAWDMDGNWTGFWPSPNKAVAALFLLRRIAQAGGVKGLNARLPS